MTAEFVRMIGLFSGLVGFLLWGAFQSLYCDHSKPPKGGKCERVSRWFEVLLVPVESGDEV